ncbi:MAG TPA: bacillithiol biosynthesis cysteine-adding enzyme BshC [Gemmatimonadaceae bacterium]|nr:bacillithiol biosynthesis cysteine-adding enzyme BshC [Gemmatimonadaceae bacterium]
MTDRHASFPRVLAEPLGGGALARAATSDAPPPFYEPRPRSAAAWRERVEAVRGGSGAHWLDALMPALGDTFAASPAARRLARSAGGRGVVVTTGQQPGLFGGPIYTWSKAIGAVTLADAIERASGVPVAPVFWAATDDADFDEASVTKVAVGPEVRTLRLSRPDVEGVPMSRVPLRPGETMPLHAQLMAAAGSMAYSRVMKADLAPYLAPGETVGGAYVKLLRAILEPLGIAVLDASHEATRAAAAPLLRRALERASEVDRALSERAREIDNAGYAAQVASVPGLSLVFRSDERGIKARVPIADAPGVAKDASPESLGTTVLLRPVVERAILPTVAYVAGPGEIAYFAQVGAVASALDVPAPLAVPRWSGTIVEPHVERALTRRALDVHDLADPHAAERRVALEEVPGEATAALGGMRAAVQRGVEGLASAGAPLPLLPAAALDGARRSLDVRLDRLERRLLAAAKRRAVDAMRDVATARASLYPDGVRQERSLNFLPLLARYGPALLDAMRASAAEHARALVGEGTATDAAPTPAAADRSASPAGSR